MSIQVIVEKCTGCTLCLKVCPFDAIRIMDRPESRGLASDSQSHKIKIEVFPAQTKE